MFIQALILYTSNKKGKIVLGLNETLSLFWQMGMMVLFYQDQNALSECFLI